MKFKHLLFSPLMAALLLTSCSKEVTAPATQPVNLTVASRAVSGTKVITQTFDEGFESGSKTAYAAADVTLSSGSWNLNNALIGTSTSDPKVGSKSVRLTSTGTLGMNFNVTSGASTVTVRYAVYGSDGSSNFQLWVSSDSGSSYSQTGATVTASSSTLSTATFTVNQAGNLRFQLRKTTGGSNRINIDEFTINSYDNSSTGGGGSTGGSTTDNSNLLMGNPSGATTSTANSDNYLRDLTYFTQSYNRSKGEPNWTSWYVGASSLGSTDRSDNFRADTGLPSGWYEVSASSYSGSGFDRGHNCPSADRTSTTAANQATFLMSNMVPQAPNNNQQTWANLENYGRSLVTAGNEIYVIMGSYGQGGTGSNGGTTTTVDNGNVVVPSNIWKVIVVLANGNNDLSRVTSSTRVIAVNTPNINSINTDWKQYRCTVRSIEQATGYNLLSALPQSVQDAIETKVDNQ
ncbi:DNA/RNA non-specific endonuclease [Mucilaginibacter robiniae]|uniref:DNA/RNA non-specific endonuclease n=1 Tax=Mucilaginibacter robiniae TaxID=2728022 RepID=A0A7L5E5R0_9SPHI|nr:DNA/RNA non-specific endonuclease [Mucilaginibacter robiniae]QJD96193.1 DNA/RNA non-specific endonuclease [Mucilaginibacter robiniae]